MTQREVRQSVWGHVQMSMDKAKDRNRFIAKVINFYEDARGAYSEAERVADLYSDDDAKKVIDWYGLQAYLDCIKSKNEFVFIGCNFEHPQNIVSPIETMLAFKEEIIDYIIKGEPCDFVNMQQIWESVFIGLPTE
jgi:hypothetical protein